MTAGPPTQSSRLSSSTVEMEAYGMATTVQRGPTPWQCFRHLASRYRAVLCCVVVCAAVTLLTLSGGVDTKRVCATAIVAVACWLLPKSYSPQCTPSDDTEAITAVALGMVNTEPGEPQTLINGRKVQMKAKSWDKAFVVRKWVVKTKLHFGTITSKPADQLCVKRWLGEQMKAEDMRDTDARAIIPVVALLASVPDAADCLAKAVEQSSVVAGMKSLVQEVPR